MRIRRLGIALMISLIAAATAPSYALATTTPTFVASYGGDNACTLASPCANTCTLDAPCRTFTHALTQTSSGGEIIVLDSADYDPVSITQSVSILAGRGVSATISVTSGHGVTVNAANIKVVLRGLSILPPSRVPEAWRRKDFAPFLWASMNDQLRGYRGA